MPSKAGILEEESSFSFFEELVGQQSSPNQYSRSSLVYSKNSLYKNIWSWSLTLKKFQNTLTREGERETKRPDEMRGKTKREREKKA